eukprot:gene1694-1662_t
MSHTAKLFTSGRSQAVRLPAAYRFDTPEVFIRQDPVTGDVILSRRPNDWSGFLAAVEKAQVPEDFLSTDERLTHGHTGTVNLQFTSPSDAHLLTGNNDTFLELQMDGDLLCFDGKLYGDWTVYVGEQHMPRSTDWTRNETLAAFHIYLQLPFGQLHRNQPRIVQLSQWIGRTASAVAMKLVNLASLDPQIVASGRRGMGNASKLDQQIWNEFLAANDPVVTEAATSFGHYAEQNGLPPFVDVLDEVPDIAEGKTSTATVQVRVNQARFRRAILASYNATCCMSGLRVPKLLVASHIVPWSMDTQNRLNPSNGLCMSALHDRAYDQGLITVLPDFTIRVGEALRHAELDPFAQTSLAQYQGKAIRLPERFRPAPAFLEAHARRFGFL